MSKINKIKVNGTPYEVEDKEAVKTVALTQAEYDALQTKDPSIFYVISDGQGGGGGMTSGEVQTMIDASISGKADSSGVTQEISAATSGKVDTTTFNTYSGAVDTALSGKQETLLSGTNIKTINNESILGSGNITISGGGSGSSAVEVTQAEYDALVSGGTLDPSVLYIITDAVGGDLSNYMTSAQTMNAISAATSTKQDILSAGTGIDITDNTISVTGGGITSGEVQDMIDESISGKVDTTTFNTYSGAVDTTLSGKQDILSAGTNITITDNVISAQLEGGTVSRGDVEDMIEEATSGLQETLIAGSGITISGNVISADAQEITVDPSLDSGSTNPVANSAITNAIANATNGTLKEDLVFSATCGYGTLETDIGFPADSALRINIYPAKTLQFIQYRTYYKNYYYKCFVLDIETKTEYEAYWYTRQDSITSSGGTGINYVTLNVPSGKLKFTVTDDTKYRIIGFGRDIHDSSSSRESYSTSCTYEVNIPSGTTTNELFQYIDNVDRTKNSIGLTVGATSSLGYQNFTNNGGRMYYSQTVFPLNTSFTAHTANTTIHVTSAQTTAWDAKVDTSAITSSVTSASTDSEVPTAKAVHDAISAGGGGGGLDDDTQLLLSTALTDLNDRKADLSEVRQNYQRKGDYATKSELAAKANVSDVMTLEKANENEQVTSYALNNLNNKFGGMKLVKITESEYAALTTKDENTLYVVIADPE